jgi:hypothetical protein
LVEGLLWTRKRLTWRRSRAEVGRARAALAIHIRSHVRGIDESDVETLDLMDAKTLLVEFGR